TGTGVQYPSLRIDFGPSYTMRVSTTQETAVPPAQLNQSPPANPPVSPGSGPPPPVPPGTPVGRAPVRPPQPPPPPVAPPPGVNTGATSGRTGAGAGSGGVGGTAPGGEPRTTPPGPATMTGRRDDLMTPSTMAGVYVLTENYLVLGIGTATGNP